MVQNCFTKVVCTDMDVHDNGMGYPSVSVVLDGYDRSFNMSMQRWSSL